ncbi:MAG: ExbD/TolR family protein [Methyloligellaceae bacterium]
MKIKTPPRKRPEENVIPLINVVFLMLVFFLVAGTLKSFSTKDIKLIDVQDEEKHNSKNVMMHIRSDGIILFNGQEFTREQLKEILTDSFALSHGDKPFYVIADRETDAVGLLEILEIVKGAGIKKVQLVAIRKGNK